MKIYTEGNIYYIDDKIYPAGNYYAVFSQDDTAISIKNSITNQTILSETKINTLQKQDDSFYSSKDDFLTDFGSFFHKASSYGGITKEPTGFASPESVVITSNGDRTITLTGEVDAYYRGVKNQEIKEGYISPAHSDTQTSVYFLIFDGKEILWLDLTSNQLDFAVILICYAFYSGSEWIYLKESHGLMQWQSHKELHETLGTYLFSGGDISGYVLNSLIDSEKRISISASIIQDEDNPTILPLLNTNSYTWLYFSDAETLNFNKENPEIINLLGNRPYYNLFSGGVWTQALFENNSYGKIFIMAIPVTADDISQKYRYILIQPQLNNASLTLIKALSSSSLFLGRLESALPEFVFIGEIIIKYTGANWTIHEVNKLIGTKIQQIAINFTSQYKDGFFDYNDLATQTTPIAYTSPDIISITNDGEGEYSTINFKPIGITKLWNVSTNQFEFSELSIGDELILRMDMIVTTTAVNQILEFHLTFDIGGFPFDLGIYHAVFKTPGTYNIVETEAFYIGSENIRDNPGELRFSSDANAQIIVNGFYISVKRRN